MTSLPRIYSYVVKDDKGLAPNICGGICTLTLCKPTIRRCSLENDWILGFWPRNTGHPNNLTYAMQVDYKIPLKGEVQDTYWGLPAFEGKKKGKALIPDNIWNPDKSDPDDSSYHSSKNFRKDVVIGQFAVVAKRFWYFGGTHYSLPDQLSPLHITEKRRQGHRTSDKLASKDKLAFLAFIEKLEKHLLQNSPGIYGKPRDLRPDLTWNIPILELSTPPEDV